MGGIRVEGLSSNVAEVTSTNNLKVQLPTTAAQVGSVRLMSENDDGSVTGTTQLKSPETSIDYRLRVGTDTLLDHQPLWGSTLSTSKFNINTSQWQVGWGQNYGWAMRLNVTSNMGAGAYACVQTRREFNVFAQNVPLYCETSWLISAAVVGTTFYEVGLGTGSGIGGTSSTQVDAAGFRITSTGIYGFVTKNGTSTLTQLLTTLTPNTVYNTTLVLGTGEIQFYINDVAYSLPFKPGTTEIVRWSGMSWYARGGQDTSPASTQYLQVNSYSVMQGDITAMMPPSHNAASIYGSYEKNSWFTGTFSNFTLDTAPSSANLSSALIGFGGHAQYPAAITTAETDRPIWTWSLSSSNNISESHRFVMTGIRICEAMVTAAVTGGPLIMQWALACNYTGTTDTDTNSNPFSGQSRVGPRHVMLGSQAITANAAAGYLSAPIDVEFGLSPIIFSQSSMALTMYNMLTCRFLGTSTTAGTIRQAFQIRGYWI